MVMNPTSATPIMRAAAVDAVRRGERNAFWRASLPVAALDPRQWRTDEAGEGSGDDRSEHDDADDEQHGT